MGDGAQLSWGWLHSCLPLRSGELIPHFALLVQLLFTYSTVFLSSHDFSHFLPTSSHFPTQNSPPPQGVAGWCWAGVKPRGHRATPEPFPKLQALSAGCAVTL